MSAPLANFSQGDSSKDFKLPLKKKPCRNRKIRVHLSSPTYDGVKWLEPCLEDFEPNCFRIQSMSGPRLRPWFGGFKQQPTSFHHRSIHVSGPIVVFRLFKGPTNNQSTNLAWSLIHISRLFLRPRLPPSSTK